MSAEIHTGLREGDVVRYTSDRAARGDRDAYWCLEGTAIVDNSGRAFDTFWRSGGDAHRLTETELATAELLFTLGDYRMLGDGYRSMEREWLTYREDQRQVVTSQHRLQKRWYVLKDAEPDLDTQVANAQAALDEALNAVAAAAREVQWKTHEVTRLQAKRGDFS